MAHDVTEPEPDPIPNSQPPVWEQVIADMRERDATGRAKYGVPLQAFNGRKPLIDAYQEVLDLAVYLRQHVIEDREKDVELKRLRTELDMAERMEGQALEERDRAQDQLDNIMRQLGPSPIRVAAELLASEGVSQTQYDRAVDLRQQAEAMCAERTRERDAMERRALAAEARIASVLAGMKAELVGSLEEAGREHRLAERLIRLVRAAWPGHHVRMHQYESGVRPRWEVVCMPLDEKGQRYGASAWTLAEALVALLEEARAPSMDACAGPLLVAMNPDVPDEVSRRAWLELEALRPCIERAAMRPSIIDRPEVSDARGEP